MFLVGARHEGRNINECDQRNVEAVAETNEACALVGCIDLERTGDAVALVCYDTDGLAFDPCESDNDVLGKVCRYFHEAVIVDKSRDHIADIVGCFRVGRYDLRDRSACIYRCTGNLIGIAFVVIRQISDQTTYAVQALKVVRIYEVCYAACRSVYACAAELACCDLFTCDRLNNGRSGDIHL